MAPTTDLLWFGLGIVVLALGGDSFARGATALAMRAGLPATAAGLALVAFAGSLPDLAVNLTAVLTGHPGLALGNVVGSSIVNLGLVLGLAALTRPLHVRLPVASVLLLALLATPLVLIATGHNNRIGYYDGVALVVLFVVVAAIVVRHRATSTQAEVAAVFASYAQTRPAAALNMLRVAVGAALLWYGAFLLVPRAVTLAQWAGVSEIFFGLTAVALATSIPQIVFGIVAARRDHGGVVFASVAGSNLFNLLLMLGVTAILSPLPMPGSLMKLELPALFALALALYPMLRGDGGISRREGAVLVAFFVALTALQLWMVTR